MYESLMADIQAYARTGVKSAQVREYALNKLKDQQLFKDSTEFQKMAMMVDLDKSVNIGANKAIATQMKKIRAAIAGIKKGKSVMSSIQRQLITFIRTSLPKTVYEKKDVVDLIRKIQALDLNNVEQIKREVFDYVTRFRVRDEKQRLEKLLNTKLAKLEGSRLKGTMSVAFQERFKKLKSNLMGEQDAMTNPSAVEAKIAELNDLSNNLQNQFWTPDVLAELEDLQFAIQYNSTLLLDDENPNKLISLEELIDKVDALVTAERSSFKDYLMEESRRYNMMKNYLLYDITGGDFDVDFNDKQSVANTDAALSNEGKAKDEKKRNFFIQGIRNVLDLFNTMILQSEDLDSALERISKTTGQLFGGIAQEIIGGRIDDSRNTYDALRLQVEKKLKENAERIFGKNYRKIMDNNSKKTIDIILTNTNPAKELKFSQNEIYYYYNLYKDPANHPSFKTMFGDNYADIMDQLISELTPEVKAWADWQVDEFYPSMYPIYNEVYKAIYRTDMPWNAHYAGRIFRDGDVDFSTINFLHDAKGFKTMTGGQSTKVRIKTTSSIRQMDGDYVLRSYLKDMNFFAAFGETFRDLYKVLNSPLIQKAMDVRVGNDIRKYLGLQAGTRLENYGLLDIILTNGTNRSNEPAILSSMTKGYVFAKLALQTKIFIYQAASFVNFTLFIGYRNYAKYSAIAFGNLTLGAKSNAYSLFKEMTENSPYLQLRGETQSIIDLMSGFGREQSQKSKSLLDRVTDGSVGHALMFFLRNGDKAGIAGSIPNYLYYKTQYAKNYGVEIDSQEAIDYAIKRVTKEIKKVAQDNEAENKSLLQATAGAIGKTVFLFASQPLQILRMEIRAIRNIYRHLANIRKAEDQRGAKGTIAENARVFVTSHFVIPVFFQFLAMGLPGIARDWDDDDEEELGFAALIGNLNQILLLGQALDVFKDYALGKPWAGEGDTPAPWRVAYELVGHLYNSFALEDPDKRLEAQIKLSVQIAELYGIPAGTMLRMFKNFEELIKGPKDFGEAFLRLGNWGERQITGDPKKKKNNPYSPSPSSKRKKDTNPYAP